MLFLAAFVFTGLLSAQTGLEKTPFEGTWEEGNGYELAFIGDFMLDSVGDGEENFWDVTVFSYDKERIYITEDSEEEPICRYSLSGNTLVITDGEEELLFTRSAKRAGTKTELEGIWQFEMDGETLTIFFRNNFMIFMLMEEREALTFSLANNHIVAGGEAISYTISGTTLLLSAGDASFEFQRIGP
jgi:hypothetical protein